MSTKTDFIPQKDADFTVFFENLERMTVAKTHGQNPPWSHIPESAVDALTAQLNAWKDAYTPTLTPHTPETTREKNRVREISEKHIRHFVNQYIRYSDKVTNFERDQAGVPNEDDTKTPVPTPQDSPEFIVEIAGPGRLRIRLRQEEHSRAAIPPGYGGAVIYWDILDEPPGDPRALTKSELATTTIHTLYFEEPDWGKRVYISLRWQTRTGRRGPYSPIQGVVIP
jgi:hypothetical protein